MLIISSLLTMVRVDANEMFLGKGYSSPLNKVD
jgi:hypothetical protein